MAPLPFKRPLVMPQPQTAMMKMGLCQDCGHSILSHTQGRCMASRHLKTGVCGCNAIGVVGEPRQGRLPFGDV